MFDALTEKLQCDCYILNDLLLYFNDSKFQIDTLIVQDTLYLYDVKNNDGDYCYENDNFNLMKTGKTITNPLDQLNRCEILLRQLLQKHGFKLPIESKLVFINPEFTLYQTPKNKPIIYPTQINAEMKKLNMLTGKLNIKHKKLADLLVSLHQVEPPYSRVPSYKYKGLRKGFICCNCQSFSLFINGRKLVCGDCGCEETIDAAVLRSTRELKLLFPDMKITTTLVVDWCGGVISKKVIKRILVQNLKATGYGQWTYYE
ncbi:nuclease-related domain-containing protein [Neobacillus sp. 19]|uniref:nuclease-related domain-containing protein n=1 Tax=Neobacillus sp. 19 TaxID=3394458 RepID=UPI003BF64737